MKVLIGHFATESNANVPLRNTLSDYDFVLGEKVFKKMPAKQVFDEHGIDVIPAVYASSGPAGIIRKEAFQYIESCFLEPLKEHISEIDGLYLELHGASGVEELGSGEQHIVKEIRKITGPYMPIAVCCDPHGNLNEEYVGNTTIIRSYRESPHTDMVESCCKVAEMLCTILETRQNIKPVYRKLPLILGGEQSVSADEPVRSINRFLEEMEAEERILSCSWHVGYIRRDSPSAGCGIVVVPATAEDTDYAEMKADELYRFVWDRRHEFHYTGRTAAPDEALRMSIAYEGKPCVITDSGDNTTSGASGWNTWILRQVLSLEHLSKRVLFASIYDPAACHELMLRKDGEKAHISLGPDFDEMSRGVDLDVKVICHGDVLKDVTYVPVGRVSIGHAVTVSVENTPVDIIITDNRQSFCETQQFEGAGIHDWTEYDIVVVKQGYIYPDLKNKAAYHVMSLTDGATPQDTASLKFKRIMRPMYPIDNI